MLRTLDETILFGVKSNIPFLKQILTHPEFVDGSFNTQFINNHFVQGAIPLENKELVDEIGEICFGQLGEVATTGGSQNLPSPWNQ